MATKKMGKGGPTNVEPKGFKPLVRIDLDKAREDTAIRDATAKRDAAQKAAMKKKYPFNKYAEGGKTMKKMGKMTDKMTKKAGGGKCYAKGGSVSSRADGCATKGKTATKMVKMAMGGMVGAGKMRSENRGGPARATSKSGGSCGMKKGK